MTGGLFLKLESFRLLILGGRFFLFFHDVIDGFRRLLRLLLFLPPLKAFKADIGKLYNVHDDDTKEQNTERINGAPSLYGEENHTAIITVYLCHKML